MLELVLLELVLFTTHSLVKKILRTVICEFLVLFRTRSGEKNKCCVDMFFGDRGWIRCSGFKSIQSDAVAMFFSKFIEISLRASVERGSFLRKKKISFHS